MPDKFQKLEKQIAEQLAEARRAKAFPDALFMRATKLRQIYSSRITHAAFADDGLREETAQLIKELMQAIWDSKGRIRSQDARHAATARHSKPGGSLDKRRQILEIWASGKHSSRDVCAEQECAALGMSFSAARKALRNAPDPA